MDKEIFRDHFMRATRISYELAKEMVSNHLPESFRYSVHLNSSFDGNPLEPGEQVFPDDLAQHGKCVGPLLEEQVIELLWRDGLVPEWIDISVQRTDGKETYFELLCCGRFTKQAEHLYYSKTVCPFGCKSPNLPPGWETGDRPFDLHWRDKFNR